MRGKDIRELAKIELKRHKKSTRTIIALFSISLIIIIPLVILLVSVNYTIDKELQKTPYLVYSDVAIDDIYSNKEGRDTIKQLENKIIYEQYYLQLYGNKPIKFIVDDEYTYQTGFDTFSIIDLKESDEIFPGVLNKYTNDIYVEKSGSGFIKEDKKQVIVSEVLLEKLGLKCDDVIGKNLTIKHSHGYLCNKYKIVGIVKKEITNLYQGMTLMSSIVFFLSNDLYLNDKAILKPKRVSLGEGNIKYEYDNEVDIEEYNKDYIMLTASNCTNTSQNNYNDTKILIYGENFKDVDKSTNNISRQSINVYVSDMYNKYKKLLSASNMISFMLLVEGVVLSIVSILYFYINLKNSYHKKKKFLSMVNVLGGEEKDIRRICLTQMNMINGLSILFFFIFGGALSIAIKYILEYVMSFTTILKIKISYLLIIGCMIFLAMGLLIVTNLIMTIFLYKHRSNSIIDDLKSEE